MYSNSTEIGYSHQITQINFELSQKKLKSPFLNKLNILIQQKTLKFIKLHLQNYDNVINELKHKKSNEEIQEFFTEFLKLIVTINNKELRTIANIIIDELWFSNILTEEILTNLPDKSCLLILLQQDNCNQIHELPKDLQKILNFALLSYNIQNQKLTQELLENAISNFSHLSQDVQIIVIDFLFQENSMPPQKQLIKFCSDTNLPIKVEYYMIGRLNSIMNKDFIEIMPTIILSRIIYSFKNSSSDKKIMRLYMNLLLEICHSDESILKSVKEQFAQLDSIIKLDFFRAINLFNIPVDDVLLMQLITKEILFKSIVQDQAFTVIKRLFSEHDESNNEIINNFIQQVLTNEIYIPIHVRNELSQLSNKFSDSIAKIESTKTYYKQVLASIPEFNKILRTLSYKDLQTTVHHLANHKKNNQSYLPVCFSRKILEANSNLQDTQNSKIVAELDSLSKDLPCAYFFALRENSSMSLAHIELIIKIGDVYILPYNLPYDQASSILHDEDKIFYHTDLSMLLRQDQQDKAPQADLLSCGALAYNYAKKILQNKSVALLEFSLCLDIQDGNFNKRFFLPPPQALKNSQSNSYINAIKCSMDKIEDLLLKNTVIYYLKLDQSNLHKPEKLQLFYTEFHIFKEKWLLQLEKVEEKRQNMMFKSSDSNKLQNVNLAYNRWKIVENVWA
jgi:hypothetical protein